MNQYPNKTAVLKIQNVGVHQNFMTESSVRIQHLCCKADYKEIPI